MFRSHRNRHDDALVVIEPDGNQRNDLLLVLNKYCELTMKIDAEGGVWFYQTVGFWDAVEQKFVKLVTGGPGS
ncbi:MAG: hypothetical protein ACXVRS_16635 [Gaiellaceae bacterium]